jgi:hypothetical protein
MEKLWSSTLKFPGLGTAKYQWKQYLCLSWQTATNYQQHKISLQQNCTMIMVNCQVMSSWKLVFKSSASAGISKGQGYQGLVVVVLGKRQGTVLDKKGHFAP